MHNTTHYRRLMLCVIMLMMMITTGCPKNNGNTPPGNGKTLDHYKQIAQHKLSMSELGAKDYSERKQKILAYATILAVLDDEEEAVDEGIKLTEKATLFSVLKLVCAMFFDTRYHFLIKLGKVPAESATTGIEIRKKTKEILDKLLEKNKDSRKELREFCLEKMKEDEKKGEEELYMFRDADSMTHWYIENGLDNEARKAFLESRGPKFMETAIFFNCGDIVDLLVKHGVSKNEDAK